MGRVARLILLVVVSVCVVFCVFCCLQNNPVFLSVTISHILKMKIMSYVFWQVSLSIKLRPEKITTGKKGTVVWPSVGINLRQPSVVSKYKHQLLREKITTGKKGTVVWPSVGMNLRKPSVVSKYEHQLRPEKIMTRKKRYNPLAYTICNTRNILPVVWLSVGINLR